MVALVFQTAGARPKSAEPNGAAGGDASGAPCDDAGTAGTTGQAPPARRAQAGVDTRSRGAVVAGVSRPRRSAHTSNANVANGGTEAMAATRTVPRPQRSGLRTSTMLT